MQPPAHTTRCTSLHYCHTECSAHHTQRLKDSKATTSPLQPTITPNLQTTIPPPALQSNTKERTNSSTPALPHQIPLETRDRNPKAAATTLPTQYQPRPTTSTHVETKPRPYQNKSPIHVTHSSKSPRRDSDTCQAKPSQTLEYKPCARPLEWRRRSKKEKRKLVVQCSQNH